MVEMIELRHKDLLDNKSLIYNAITQLLFSACDTHEPVLVP